MSNCSVVVTCFVLHKHQATDFLIMWKGSVALNEGEVYPVGTSAVARERM